MMNERIISYIRVRSFIDSWALKRDQFVTSFVHHETANCTHNAYTLVKVQAYKVISYSIHVHYIW